MADDSKISKENGHLNTSSSKTTNSSKSSNTTKNEASLNSKSNIDLKEGLKQMILEQNKQKEQIWKFWKTQPVPAINEDTNDAGIDGMAIEPDKESENIKKEPYNLPKQFKWSTLDILKENEIDEVYNLLNENYVEDEDAMFRFDYSKDFLKWALMPPNFYKDWHIGVRVEATNQLVAFISGIPAKVRFSENSSKDIAEINFLCVHKVLRGKRVAPTLIKEVTRRIHLKGIFQAAYTAGVELPKPVAKARYFHRSINIKKLLDIKFTKLCRKQTLNNQRRLFKLPDKVELPNFRPMTETDAPEVLILLKNYLSKMRLSPDFNLEDFKHWLLPRKDVVYSYVIQDQNTKKITNFASFYKLPSTVMTTNQHNTLNACYSFYNVVSQDIGWKKMMYNMLIQAKIENMDVFNALACMDNREFLDELKFGGGDGELHYYLYNWKLADINDTELGLILL